MLNQGFRWIVLLCFMASQAYSQSQSVQEYARECAKAVGGGVPAFSCKQGALIPIKNYANDSTCDNPAFLSGVSNGCIQRSRFGKLTPTDLQPGTSADDIEIRFLCRHYLLPSNPSDYDERFDDIAVIQTNKKTGATCFYQSSTGASQDMAGTNIPAPADASARTITSVGPQGCIGCHNARPFINTPFLQSVPEPHKIPHPNQFNRNQYWFPGESGRNAKIFNITTADTTCTTCHNIASSEENSPGGSSGNLADESIGTSLNPNTGTFDHAYMKIYAPNNFNSVMSSYKECISAGSGNRPANCKVVDISSAARNAYDAGSTWIPPVLSSTPVVDGKVYSLVGGFSNKCLDVIGASTNNGAKLQQWDCNGSSGQKFRFKRVRDDLWAFASLSSNRCVSSESGKLDNRNPMLLWDCNYTPDQLVRFRSLGNGGYKIVWASSDKCMDVQDTSADNGKAVFQYECTDVPDQNWSFREVTDTVSSDSFDGQVFTMVGGYSGKCLDTVNDGTSNGTQLQQWNCDGGNSQKFRFKLVRDGYYTFANVNANRCVSAEAANSADRTMMILWDCKDSKDQLVRLQPSANGSYKVIFSHSDKCMDVQDTSMDSGKSVFQYQCVDVPDQNWYLKKN